MRICNLSIKNFRGVAEAELVFPSHTVLIGDNNTGKSTVLEALDLVLGPDRAHRMPPVDEHDFFQGKYILSKPEPAAVAAVDTNEDPIGEAEQVEEPAEGTAPVLRIDATVCDLSDEQKARFFANVEWWDDAQSCVLDQPTAGQVATASPCIRVSFIGWYDTEDDDFSGETFFTKTDEDGQRQPFRKKDKQTCGFLYLRTLRTGSRALSLERGSLLDIILRLQEARPKLWEDSLESLSTLQLSDDAEGGLGEVLESVNAALKKYVPKEWGAQPQLRVSNLTREHLRKIVTAFMSTGDGEHLAPYYRQGTGTINMLVLALLSQIAAGKQNVIFAMEEPEIAIPPYAQKQIVNEVRKLSSQTIFTSHSPYVIEEFRVKETVPLSRDAAGVLRQREIVLPASIKPKFYRQNFRTVFCEGLLSSRVLLAEGATEAIAFPAVARRLSKLRPADFKTLESIGVCTIDAGSESKIIAMAGLYRGLGKEVICTCDDQDAAVTTDMKAALDLVLMHDEKGFEKMVLAGTTEAAMERYIDSITWPQALQAQFPTPKTDLANAMQAYLSKYKGEGVAADFLVQCEFEEIPEWIRNACLAIQQLCVGEEDDPEPLVLAGADA
ncbi:ATP-dependent endonuclease [Pseudovibrio sp. Ad37]|uniref:ATP-dependent nuclease n=1 Tax=Pseudovibrio sp. Ad37 TaxID=989422 RepID=UPI0007AEB9CD|nr:AAA family ATPase [Pseudovibrio sp. Ad37]KZL24256.1 DNA replication and repair protein RecF [Pseudovibrio sp. Ad37]